MSAAGTSFYVTGGTLGPDAPSYVERRADQDLLDGLLASEFCYVLTSRQMGKSSLMVRTANKLRDQAVHVIALDLSAVGQNVTPEQWYNGLLMTAGDQLGLEDELEDFWLAHPGISPVQRWFTSMRKVVLARRSGPVVVFVDEIDAVRSLPFSTDEFFAAIRESYNRRAEDREFKRLAFCLLGVATPSDLVRNTSITPFNIGRRIDLDDFTAEEASSLTKGLHTDSFRSTKLLRRVLHWTSGHPYLTQRLCLALARDLQAGRRDDVDRQCDELFLSSRARERDDNLIFVRERLLRSELDLTGLLELYLRAWNRQLVFVDESNPLVSVLRLSGILRAERGRLVERNHIYHSVFDRDWVKANLPAAEARRQREAYRRGVIRATALASIIIALALLSFIAVRRTSEASLAKAKAWSTSSRMGQRIEYLKAIEQAKRWGWLFGDQSALRDEAIATLNLADMEEWGSIESPQAATTPPELNADFSRYAVGDKDGRISIFNAATKKAELALPTFELPVQWLRFGPTDEYLGAVYGDESGNAHAFVLWRLADKSKVVEISAPLDRNAWDISPDGGRLAIGLSLDNLQVYSLPGGVLIPESVPDIDRLQGRPVWCLRFDPAGERVAVCSRASLDVTIWSFVEKKAARFHHPDGVVDLDWHPGGHQMITACENGDVYFLDVPSESKERLYSASLALTRPDVSYNHLGTVVAAVCRDLSFQMWRPQNRRQTLSSFDLNGQGSLRFSADDRWLSLTGKERRVRLFKVEGGSELVTFQGEPNYDEPFQSIGFGPPETVLIAAGPGGSIWFWDLHDQRSISRLNLSGIISGAQIDNQRAALLASTTSGFLELPLRTDPRSANMRLHVERERCLKPLSGLGRFALTTNGSAAVIRAGQAEDHIHVFDLRDSDRGSRFEAGRKLERIGITPDSRWLFASTAPERDILVWDLAGATRQPFRRFQGSRFLSLSPSGKWLVELWQEQFQCRKVGSWGIPPLSLPHTHNLGQSAPAGFGKIPGSGECLLAVATFPTIIELYRFLDDDSPKVEKLGQLESPDRLAVESLIFDATGSRLAVGSRGQIVQVWDLARIREDLDQRGLASGFPQFQPLSPNKVRFVVEPADTTSKNTPEALVREELLTRLDNHSEAIEAAQAHGNTNFFEHLVRRGRVFQDLNQRENALQDFRKASELRPNDLRLLHLIKSLEREKESKQGSESAIASQRDGEDQSQVHP